MILLKIDLDKQKKKKKKNPPNQLIYHCSLSNEEDAPTTVSLILVGKLDVCMYVYKYIIV